METHPVEKPAPPPGVGAAVYLLVTVGALWGFAALALSPVPVWVRASLLVLAVAAAAFLRGRMERRQLLLLLGAAGLVAGSALRAAPTPSNDRDWTTGQERAVSAEIAGGRTTIHGVRNFRYAPSGAVTTVRWEDRSYDLDTVSSLWFGVSPFGAIPGVGHVFVSFGFDDGRYLAVSVEARRERDETYGPVSGLFRRYEVAYILADERDLVALRTNVWQDDVYLYPVRADAAAARALLLDILARANGLSRQPEFYDTLFNSCSSNLARHANRVAPGRIPRSLRVLLAGFSDELALELGLIDFDGSPAQARARFRVNERAAGDVDRGDFPARLRAPLAPAP